jgi:hypothetical protein
MAPLDDLHNVAGNIVAVLNHGMYLDILCDESRNAAASFFPA